MSEVYERYRGWPISRDEAGAVSWAHGGPFQTIEEARADIDERPADEPAARDPCDLDLADEIVGIGDLAQVGLMAAEALPGHMKGAMSELFGTIVDRLGGVLTRLNQEVVDVHR